MYSLNFTLTRCYPIIGTSVMLHNIDDYKLNYIMYT
jgi:hypothetical protein